jgi:hypothetical protein
LYRPIDQQEVLRILSTPIHIVSWIIAEKMYSGKRFLKKRFSLFTAAQFFTAKGFSLYAPHSFRSLANTKPKE